MESTICFYQSQFNNYTGEKFFPQNKFFFWEKNNKERFISWTKIQC